MNRKFSNLTFIWIGAGDDNVLYVFKANRDTKMAILRIKKCPQLLVLRRGLAYRFRWTVAFTVGGGFCRWTMLKQNPARLEVTLFGCPVKSRFAVAVLQQGIGFVRQEELQDRFAACAERNHKIPYFFRGFVGKNYRQLNHVEYQCTKQKYQLWHLINFFLLNQLSKR